jgi:citrate lyase subunit beta/citryl-CoA lyase
MGKRDAKPVRTVLFCAADDREAVEHGYYRSGADSIVIDMEEPRTPFPESERERARVQVRAFMDSLTGEPPHPLIFVRVQSPRSGQALKDLRAAMSPHMHGILVPKVDGPADIAAADALLAATELEFGLPVGSVNIYPVLETAQALRLAYEIAIASDRVAYMGGAVSKFGDIVQALGFRWTREGNESHYLRSKVLVDATAAGVRYPTSGNWGGRIDDEEGLRNWCKELRDLGYYGMIVGNPKLVPIIHEMFTPTDDEVSYWLDLDRLATEAERTGVDRITYGDPNQGEGHVVHIAHVGAARLNLQWARDLGVVPA